MKTKQYVLQILRAAFMDRLLLIIIALMIASLFSVLPIKGCSGPGPSSGPGTAEISTPVSMAS